MTDFYTNKYPVKYGFSGQNIDKADIPVGTVFTISGINGNSIELEPINEIGDTMVIIDVQTLEFAFTKSAKIKKQPVINQPQ